MEQLVGRHALLAPPAQGWYAKSPSARAVPSSRHDGGTHGLAPDVVRRANRGALRDSGVLEEGNLDLGGQIPYTPALDDVCTRRP